MVCGLLAAGCGERPVPAVGVAGSLASPGVVELARAVLADSGVDSTRLRIVTMRSESGLAGEVRRAARLAREPGMVAVVGHVSSRATLLAAPIYGDARLPLFVPSATSRRLGDAGAHVFLMAPSDSMEGEFIVGFLRAAFAVQSVTVVYVSDEYGVGLRNGVAAAAGRTGIRVIDAVAVAAADCPSDAADPYMVAARASLRRGRPGAVVVATPSQAAGCVVRAFRELVPGVPIITGDGAEPNAGFRLRAEAAADGTHFVAFWHAAQDPARGGDFIERFRAVAGREPFASEVVWFDAIMLAAHVTRAAGGRPARALELAANLGGSEPAFEGVIAPIGFAAGRRLPLVVLRYRDGTTSVARP